jgi:hypothetical protein
MNEGVIASKLDIELKKSTIMVYFQAVEKLSTAFYLSLKL